VLPRIVAVFASGQQVVFYRRTTEGKRPEMFDREMVAGARDIPEVNAAKIAVAGLGSHRIAFDRRWTRLRRSDVTRLFGAFAEFPIAVQSRRKVKLLAKRVADLCCGQVAFSFKEFLGTPNTPKKDLQRGCESSEINESRW
jgi:hypothetical protein